MKKYQTLKQEIYDLDALPPEQQSVYEAVWNFYQQAPDWDTFTAFLVGANRIGCTHSRSSVVLIVAARIRLSYRHRQDAFADLHTTERFATAKSLPVRRWESFRPLTLICALHSKILFNKPLNISIAAA